MADEISISLGFNYSKNGVLIQRSLTGTFDVSGNGAIQNVQTIEGGAEVLDVADVGTNGILLLHNLEAFVEVTQPIAPTVTPQGTGGAATWTYKIVAKQSDGAYSSASSGGTTAVGNATLTIGNFNRITWTAVAGADSYDIYRTAHGSSPSTNGLIGTATTATFDDTGLAGDSATAPATGHDNTIILGENGTTSYPIRLLGQDFAIMRFNGNDIYAKTNTNACKLEYILIEE